MQHAALLADIGGTHARFGLQLPDQTVAHIQVIRDHDATDVVALCRAYLAQIPHDYTITQAAWAVAGPIMEDSVTITNRGWDFSQRAVQTAFGWDAFYVVNDFAALALALPHLGDADCVLIKPGVPPVPPAALAVLGPGTGLGVAGLVPVADGWHVLPGEGGHCLLPLVNDTEQTIARQLYPQHPYLAAEYVLSGRGLLNLYGAMAPHAAPGPATPEALAAAMRQGDPVARQVVDQFCAFLGNVAGDMALTLGARGGVYLAGGILPQMVDVLQQSAFVTRFMARDVVTGYLEAIPVWLITHPLPSFRGLQTLLVKSG